jgi:predicted DNA-binding transcriptional regulator
MKTKRKGIQGSRRAMPNAVQVWADIEDRLVPNLHLALAERVLYFHLTRKTRLSGKRKARTSVGEIAQDLRLCKETVRATLHRLAQKGVLRILESGYGGHLLEVRLPREIRGGLRKNRTCNASLLAREDFFKSGIARLAIFERDRHRCFYCLAPLAPKTRALDHVVPRKRGGGNSFRNMVACCFACNTLKKNSNAVDFLRKLLRLKVINRPDFHNRIVALRELKLGLSKPVWPKAA